MCATCGCAAGEGVRVIEFGLAGQSVHAHEGQHAHDRPNEDLQKPHVHRPHVHSEHDTITLTLEQRVLAKNDAIAARNREWLAARRVRAVNVMSSPGSGKTTLLERTLRELRGQLPMAVVEGDQETTFDAQRIEATGTSVVQINTGSGCHLDASMFGTALDVLRPDGGLVLIENVGNLVCPALFDLGETDRVVVMSVTEGADKPLKYPHMFRSATLVVLNKVDLLPYVDFDVSRFERDLSLISPAVELIGVSATRGDGIDRWYHWLRTFSAA
jgi:hydrogenase nickel incorporation protein HypB